MSVLADIRQSIRSLLRSPGFACLAIVTLALAIGANTAIYSVLRGLVLNPLPFRDADRFVYLWHKNPDMGGMLITPPRRVVDQWRGATQVFDAVESFTARTFVMTGRIEPEEVKASVVWPSTFAMLGVAPRIGRGIIDADTRDNAPNVAIISDGLWKRRFGSDADILSKTITLSGASYAIVGVMSPDFQLPMGSDALWIAAKPASLGDAGQNTIGKLKAGVTRADAQRVLEDLGKQNVGDKDLVGWRGQILEPADNSGAGSALTAMSGAVGMLLLIACVNVASLMLSRNSHRQREMAVRHTLGASRRRILRLLLIESLVLAAAGGLVGVLVSQWMLAAITALRPRQLDVLTHIHVDGPVLGFAAVIALLTAVLFGVLPALSASRVDLNASLKLGGRGTTSSTQRLRQVLTTAQVALALVLLVGATLLLRSLEKKMAVNTGIDPVGVISMRVALPAEHYKTPVLREAFYNDLVASVSALPGVTSAALGNGVPPDSGIMFGTVDTGGARASTPSLFSGGFVSPLYFSTLRIPIVSGRSFTAADVDGSDPVVIIGRTFASTYFGDRSPIGRRMRIDPKKPMATVIGVASDVQANDLGRDGIGAQQLYFPRAQVVPGFAALIVRTNADTTTTIAALKAKVWAMDPQLAIREVVTAQTLVAQSASRDRFNVALLSTFALSGLILAGVGVYGVMTIFVGQRKREMGVRIALGATPAAVASLVLRQAAIVLAAGITIGALASLLLTKFIAFLLFDVGRADAASFGAAIAVVSIAALFAIAAPIRRAMRVDPAKMLRAD